MPVRAYSTIRDLSIDCYVSGKEFRIYGRENMFPVHSVMNSEVSDLPASRKIEGLASFSSKVFMCPQCDTPSYYLADPRGFKPEGKIELSWPVFRCCLILSQISGYETLGVTSNMHTVLSQLMNSTRKKFLSVVECLGLYLIASQAG